MRHPVALTIALSSFLLSSCVCALALDPSLDISQYAHTAWKVRDGFVKGAIVMIAQTPDGYLWLGTELGLFRFDGVRAVPWQPTGDEQLPSSFISGLLLAHDGTLWIGTLKGLASYKDGRLTQYPELAGASIGLFLEDHEHTVWFGTRQAAVGKLCAMRGRNVECYGAGSFGPFVNPLYEDQKGNLWLNSASGVWRWAPGSPERYALPPGVIATNTLAEDDSGTLLLGTTDGVKRLVAGKSENYTLPGISSHFMAFKFLHATDGALWIGTSQGLLRLYQGRVDRFSSADGLSGDVVQGIFVDREGTVWAGTTDGLDRFREYSVPTISRNQGLSASAGLVQATSDGGIWTDTAEGLERWESGGVTLYRGRSALNGNRISDETKPKVSGATTIANSGLLGTPRSLGRDDEGRLWVSTSDGVFYFERGRFVRVSGIPVLPSGYSFAIDGDG
ncbi:MAG TPA: two-component regulator propeller domain-containing protein, partial [Candidatus Sulfotelmatobacter sp.]|nr:two-component regulator propeller domain-containing protein [Candidatus Sulfotelmatobacter sp.]